MNLFSVLPFHLVLLAIHNMTAPSSSSAPGDGSSLAPGDGSLSASSFTVTASHYRNCVQEYFRSSNNDKGVKFVEKMKEQTAGILSNAEVQQVIATQEKKWKRSQHDMTEQADKEWHAAKKKFTEHHPQFRGWPKFGQEDFGKVNKGVWSHRKPALAIGPKANYEI